jgi:hypothetical protein
MKFSIDSEKTVINVLPICLVAFFIGGIGGAIVLSNRRLNDRNTQFHKACAPLVLVSSFTDIDKSFVVCAPEYVSSPNDFVVREVR